MIDFNNRNEVINKLKELKAKKLPHMTIEQFAKIDSDFANDIIKATDDEKNIINKELNEYYYPENGENKCVFNDESPNLYWGLAHGSAIDERTGLSWRCYHYFIINGQENKYVVTLQYHPDGYEINE